MSEPTPLPGAFLPGVNVLLEGPTGTGKTYSLGTIAEYGGGCLDLHYFSFESGSESLRGYFTDSGKKVPPNLYFHTVKVAQASWTERADAVKMVNTLPYDLLKKASDPNRNKYDQFEKFLRSFNAPTDDEGRKFPNIDQWDTNKVVAIDGLTGLGNAALAAVIGGKVDRDQKDWGLAQNLVENTLRQLCDACKCHFILLSHVEKEPDPLGGPALLTVSTLGRALPAKIPPMFSDVALAKRVVKDFTWSTIEGGADLKARNLPWADKIPPNFGIILDKWRSRGGVVPERKVAP